MNLQEIANQATTLAGKPINLLFARRNANEGMINIANQYDTACIQDSFDVNEAECLKEYQLPLECIGVIKVINKVCNCKTKEYITDFGFISFRSSGSYVVTYLRLPKDIPLKPSEFTQARELPEINPAFHLALCYFVAAKYILGNTEDPKSNDKAAVFMQNFQSLIENANNKLRNMKRRNKSIKAPLWR